jgi:transposase InsO family protein
MIHSLKDEYPVNLLCEALEVSRSSYYDWIKREPSPRSLEREKVIEQIRRIHIESDRTYGSPRIRKELIDHQITLNIKTVAKYMKQAKIQAKMHRRFKVSTTDSNHQMPVFENKLDRNFTAAAPNQKWLCDITYIATKEGFIYLATVLDTFSRKIIGWSIDDCLDRRLCIDALKSAIEGRNRMPGGLIDLMHHSDRGSQYASKDYQQILDDWDITVSMSRVGNCWDNAMMESFFGTLKTELVYHENYESKSEARSSVIAWIEGWYNRRRRHSAIGYLSPEAFEARLN